MRSEIRYQPLNCELICNSIFAPIFPLFPFLLNIHLNPFGARQQGGDCPLIKAPQPDAVDARFWSSKSANEIINHALDLPLCVFENKHTKGSGV